MGRDEKQKLVESGWEPGTPGEAPDIDTEAKRRRFYRFITGGKTFEDAMEIFNGKSTNNEQPAAA